MRNVTQVVRVNLLSDSRVILSLLFKLEGCLLIIQKRQFWNLVTRTGLAQDPTTNKLITQKWGRFCKEDFAYVRNESL